jgi:hypothetical protein
VAPRQLLEKIEDESAVQRVARCVRPIDIAALWEAEIHCQRDRHEEKKIDSMVEGGGSPAIGVQAKYAAGESQTQTSPSSTIIAIKPVVSTNVPISGR